MKRMRKFAGAVAIVAVIATVAACSSSSGSGKSSGPSGNASNGNGSNTNVAAAFNAANVGWVNKSTKTGGTLPLAASGDCDSWDPVATYYAWCWNMQRLFTRTLVGYASLPGVNNATKLEPDAATALGEHNADFTQWTYKLKSGLKWQDGSPVTSEQFKFGFERMFTDFAQSGPISYFTCTLSTCDSDGTPAYKGPYTDKSGLSTIETPNDSTIVFKLSSSQPDWDYLMTLPATAAVPATEGGGDYTGARYTLHVMSDGPFMFKSYNPNTSVDWVRNPNWSQATDTIRKPLVDEIKLTISTNPDDNDKQLAAGAVYAEADGGVQNTFQAQIVNDATKKKQADDPVTGFTRYFAVYPSTIPNLHCRLAIFYAMNKVDLQKARGGSYAGEIAPNMTPAIVPGADASYNPYPSGSDNTGDLTKAKAELKACGKPNGFSTNMGYVNQGKAKDVFTAAQNALKRVGINLGSKTHEQAGYYGQFIGQPSTVKAQDIGIAQAGWGSDYPTGGGFWNSIALSSAPAAGGNYTQINSPTIDNLLHEAAKTAGTHDDIFAKVDQQVMQLGVDLPYLYDKTLFYRDPKMTNVRINFAQGSYYDFVNAGVSS